MGTCQSTHAVAHIRPAAEKEPSLDITAASNPETSHPMLQAIEKFQQGRPFGRLLDAGTGLNSLQWIAHLVHGKERFGVTDWVAVTASDTMIDLCTKEGVQLGLDTQNHLIKGNWFGGPKDEQQVPEVEIDFPVQDQLFDTILVDYLVGAMDAFSPFCQDCIFERLAKHLKPGGRLYLLGLEPMLTCETSETLVGQVQRVRDACTLLSGERVYREHPLSWVTRNLPRSGLQVLQTSKFPLLHRPDDLMDQVKTARWMVHHPHDIRNGELAGALEHELDQLERQIHGMKAPIRLGFDYMTVAEKPMVE